MAEREKLKYGGYVQYPLPPKDIRNLEKLVQQYNAPGSMQELLEGFFREEYGVKVEPNADLNGWKAVIYNLNRVVPENDKTYYISGESDTLLKALVVCRYKLESVKDMGVEKWISDKPKGEFR